MDTVAQRKKNRMIERTERKIEGKKEGKK